jgi:hypothetical protein
MGSRKEATRLIARAATKKAASTAATKSNAFTEKQSHFARREDEKQMREVNELNPGESRFEMARRNTASTFGGSMGGPRPKKDNKFALKTGSGGFGDSKDGAMMGSVVRVDPDDLELDEPESKKAKKERFEDVISDNRRDKAGIRRDRTEQQEQTVALDQEIEELMHLLPKRNKRDEELKNFQELGRPDVKALLAQHETERNAKRGRTFVLGSGGELEKQFRKSDENQGLTADDKKLLASISNQPVMRGAIHDEPAAPVDTAGVDDFDALLGTYRLESRKALATERLPTEAEEAAALLQKELQQLDRGEKGKVSVEDGTAFLSRKEWLEQGGDNVYHMNDSDDGRDIGEGDDDAEDTEASPAAGNDVDVRLGALEAFCEKDTSDRSAAERSAELSALLQGLWVAANRHPKHTVESFRLLLIDVQRLLYKERALRGFHFVILYAAAKLFPTTDFRHAIMTPLMVLLGALATQTKLQSPSDAARALFFASLLANVLQGAKRFSAEPVLVALNVIALQVPRTVLEPVAHRGVTVQFPVMDRASGAILHCEGAPAKTPTPLSLTSLARNDASALDVVGSAYVLLRELMELFGASPSFTCLFDDAVTNLFGQIAEAAVHPAVAALHEETRVACRVAAQSVIDVRAPLAMRSFRPRPLRQFEPLMTEEEEASEMRMHREMKREHREDRKRVVRHVQAEATVERRAREKEHHAEDTRRADTLRGLMGELQEQQHLMKTADTLLSKAKSKKRGKGVPDEDGGKGKGKGGGDDD